MELLYVYSITTGWADLFFILGFLGMFGSIFFWIHSVCETQKFIPPTIISMVVIALFWVSSIQPPVLVEVYKVDEPEVLLEVLDEYKIKSNDQMIYKLVKK